MSVTPPSAPASGGPLSSVSTFVRKPLLLVVYGPPKHYKTTIMVAGLGGDCLFICRKGNGLISSEETVGIKVRCLEVNGLHEANNVLEYIVRNGGLGLSAVAIDESNLMADHTKDVLEAGGLMGWPLYEAVGKQFTRLVMLSRFANFHVVLTAHQQDPNTEKGVVKTGPLFPGRVASALLNAEVDGIIRMKPAEGRWPWPVTIATKSPSEEYVQGCRLAGFVDGGPPNIGEALRASGYPLNYPVPWMAPAVAHIVTQLSAGVPQADVTREMALKILGLGADGMPNGKAPFTDNMKLVTLALQNGFDRYEIERHLKFGALSKLQLQLGITLPGVPTIQPLASAGAAASTFGAGAGAGGFGAPASASTPAPTFGAGAPSTASPSTPAPTFGIK